MARGSSLDGASQAAIWDGARKSGTMDIETLKAMLADVVVEIHAHGGELPARLPPKSIALLVALQETFTNEELAGLAGSCSAARLPIPEELLAPSGLRLV